MNIRKVITNFGPDKTLSEVLFTCENRRWKVYDWCEGKNAHGFLLLLRKEKEQSAQGSSGCKMAAMYWWRCSCET